MPHSLTIGLVCSIGIGASRGGRVSNEDNYLVCRDGEIRFRDGEVEVVRNVENGAGTLLAVADGMGGHENGAIASAAAVQALAVLYEKGAPTAPELELHRFVLAAHRRIRSTLARRGPVTMGTTLTACWILDDRLFWIHIGNSRLYHYRGTKLTRLTRDHTRGEFAARDRRPPPKEANLLAQNFVYGSRGLGDDTAIRIDPGRDTGFLRLSEGDRVLLCTDGLTRFVDDYRIAYALGDVPSCAACAEVLQEKAIAMGSNDNITVMIARVDSLSSPSYQYLDGDEDNHTLVPL